MRRFPHAYRTVAVVLSLWVGGRLTATYWPIAAADDVEAAAPERLAGTVGAPPAFLQPDLAATPIAPPAITVGRAAASERQVSSARPMPEGRPSPLLQATVSPVAESSIVPPVVQPPAGVLPPQPRQIAVIRTDRWLASAWLLYRNGGGGSGLAPVGQLGGSQAGARLWRDLAPISGVLRFGANARLSAALRGTAQREAALGLGLRLGGKVPVELVAENRFGIEKRGRDAVALYAATGVDDLKLPLGVRLSGYGQAGMVGLKRRDGFVDGSVRAEREILTGVRLGFTGWGAAQPGLSRVDVGPSLALRAEPLGRPMRISLEWRQRVAGDARPGSGPSLTIGTDF